MAPQAAAEEILVSSKHQLRERLHAERKQMPAPLRAEKAIAAASRALQPLQARKTVAVYSAIGSEIDPSSVITELRSLGVSIVFPRISKHSFVLDFCAIANASELSPGPLGIPEPATDAPRVALADIDAFLIPALAFDHDGNRLGWGKGYYDYTLAQNSHALRVGFCFQEQIVASIPCQPTDQSMDWFATDSKLYPGRKREGATRPKDS